MLVVQLDGFHRLRTGQPALARERSGNRALYLGPVYDRYSGLFSCEDDSLLADFDPLYAALPTRSNT